VLLAPEIVLLVNVAAVSIPNSNVVASGKVNIFGPVELDIN
jgi:hypothetical protein